MVRYVFLSACNQRLTESALRRGKGGNARGRWTIKNVRKQGQHGTRPGAVGTSHQQTLEQTRSHACVRIRVSCDSGRPTSQRLGAALTTILYVYFCVRRYSQNQTSSTRRESGRYRSSSRRSSSDPSGNGAREDRADEQESPCAIVQVLIAHARFLQDFVYNLHAVDTCCVSLWICGEANAIH